MIRVTIAQLRATPTVDLMTAAAALGLGRTKAYELARRAQFPCRVIRIGEVYRVPTAPGDRDGCDKPTAGQGQCLRRWGEISARPRRAEREAGCGSRHNGAR
jgi:hypothetical protein